MNTLFAASANEHLTRLGVFTFLPRFFLFFIPSLFLHWNKGTLTISAGAAWEGRRPIILSTGEGKLRDEVKPRCSEWSVRGCFFSFFPFLSFPSPADEVIWWHAMPPSACTPSTWGARLGAEAPRRVILWRERESRGGTPNAPAHNEAANYGDRVCHLILCSFHHNLPHWAQRKKKKTLTGGRQHLGTSHRDLPGACFNVLRRHLVD